MPAGCPGAKQLKQLILDQAPQDAALVQHLDTCPNCRQELERLAGDSPWVRTAAQTPANRLPVQPRLQELIQEFRSQPPTKIFNGSSLGQTEFAFLQPSGNTNLLGLLGIYEVIGEIARGAMGIVFKARDTRLNRVVAIKVLAPALAHDDGARARFLREARAAAAIAHPHVITIHAVEETREVPYLVMQCVEGKSLAQRIKAAGRLHVEDVLRIGIEIASGLGAAHQLGLIHRDIKPSNILLEHPGERVKITDFGLARAVDDTGLTLPGHIAGTPQYMAPEQARGEAIDQRADLFSFGCVLYEMATGVSPFEAPTPMVALRKVCEEEPEPAHVVNPLVPEWLSSIIAQLLVKDSRRRLGSAQAVAEQLNSYHAPTRKVSRPAMSVAPSPTERPVAFARRGLWAAAGTMGVVALGLLSWAVLHWIAGSTPKVAAGPPAQAALQAVPAAAPDRFIVTSGPTGSAQRFGTLADAIEKAPARAAIEFQFNGELEVAPIDLTKPLIFRAAPEFKPVLVTKSATQALFRTYAPLVLEGLTFKANIVMPEAGLAPFEDGPARNGPRRESPLMFVESTGAGLLVSNCRFLVGAQTTQTMPRGPTAIGTVNSTYTCVENCMFFGVSGRAMEGLWEGPAGVTTFSVRNCALLGEELVSLIARSRTITLQLLQNTIASKTLIHAPGKVSVLATGNVFAVESIHHRDDLAPPRPLPEFLTWKDAGNVYAVHGPFAQFGRLERPDKSLEIGTFSDWKKALQISTETSVVVSLELFNRLKSSASFLEQNALADFKLTHEETNAVQQLGGPTAHLGADLAQVGPDHYESWRRSARYREWRELVRQQGFPLQ